MNFKKLKNKTIFFLSGLVLSGGVLAPVSAAEKLNVQVSVGEHPFLPGYEAGQFAYLGDQWSFDVEVLDSEGDPAPGVIVRFYNGTKSVGYGRVDSDGIANIKISWTKLGTQKFRILASDSETAASGQTFYRIDILNPRVARIFSKSLDIVWNYGPGLTPDLNLVQSNGCLDSSKYWENIPAEYLKRNSPKEKPYALWPFTTNKNKRPWDNKLAGTSYDEWEPLLSSGDFDVSKLLGAQTLCETDDGELIILK